MSCDATGVTALNLTATRTCRPRPPLTGRTPHALYELQLPRSPDVSTQVRTAKQAIWLPLKELLAHPFGSPQTPAAVVQVPHADPGPTEPQAVVVLGMPVLGSSRTALPMSLVSEMMPMRAPARAAPAASIASQYARPTSTVRSTNTMRAGAMSANSTRAWPRWRTFSPDRRVACMNATRKT